MIDVVKIKNYKSIEKMKLELGRVNVLIGANGCGKSNILEAIGMGAAAAGNKLANEFLGVRVRVTDPIFMRSAFEEGSVTESIQLIFEKDSQSIDFQLNNDNKPFSKWKVLGGEIFGLDVFLDEINDRLIDLFLGQGRDSKEFKELIEQRDNLEEVLNKQRPIYNYISEFLTYAPENNKIRNFHEESQIEPLGIYGEGLYKLLSVSTPEEIKEIKENLQLIEWFDDFEMGNGLSMDRHIKVKDRYINENVQYFDHTSTNEGFLFLLFYLTLFVSQYTPKFFAIDNIDNALNPSLCSRLMEILVKLAEKYDKQVILTTHNPAILDGLNINDSNQKLYVISRNGIGRTRARLVKPMKPQEGEEPVKLSEAFMRGYLGGLNKNYV